MNLGSTIYENRKNNENPKFSEVMPYDSWTQKQVFLTKSLDVDTISLLAKGGSSHEKS